MTVEDLRKQFMTQGLRHQDLSPDPLTQFDNWYQYILDADIYEPGAMTLATVDEHGHPSQRIVLLKSHDEEGFIFFTNYNSSKARHISVNPSVCVLFPWHQFARQVIIKGTVSKISTEESLKYFSTRPRGSQLGAWASRQSQAIASRSILETDFKKMQQEFADKFIPLPPFWGGYCLVADSYEFWQGRESRLHDRFIYRRNQDDSWDIERVAP